MTEPIWKETRRQTWVLLVTAIVVIVFTTAASGWSIVRSNQLSSCNKRTIQALQERTIYNNQISKLTDERNAALLSLLQASSSNTVGVAFVEAIKSSTDWPTARNKLSALFDSTSQQSSLDAVLKAYDAYQRADQEQKVLTTQRDRIKLPSLADCL